MFKKSSALILALLTVAACAASQPRVIQASPGNTPDIQLTVGMATQVEMPDGGRVQSLTIGNPDLVTADQAGDVVNLTAKGAAGETNIIIRARDDSGRTQVYQYHIMVQAR